MKLRIGSFNYEVVMEDNPKGESGNDIDGQVRTFDGVIRLRAGACPQFTQQVMLHEAVHAICYQYGIRQLSEHDTDVMATAIMSFIKDNKEFIEEIGKH